MDLEYFRHVVQHLPSGAAYIFDRDMRFIVAQGPEIEAAGFASSYFEGKHFTEVLDADTRARLLPYNESALAGRRKEGEFTYRDQEYMITSGPVWGDGEQPAGGIVFVHNITEYKRTEHALHETRNILEHMVAERTVELKQANEHLQTEINQRRQAMHVLREYEQAIEDSDVLFAVIDDQFRFRTINRSLLRLCGCTRAQATGAHVANIFGREMFESLLHAPMRRCLQGHIVRETLSYDFPALGVRWVTTTLNPLFNDDTKVTGLVATGHDITDLHRAEAALRDSEQRFRLAFSHSPLGMALISNAGRLLQVNDAFCSMLGYTESALTGQSITDIIHPDDDDSEQLLHHLMQRQIPSFTINTRYMHEDGRAIWTRMTAGGIHKHDGQILYGLAMIEDITEQRQLAEKAHKHECELAHMSRLSSLGEMAGGIAHEINQPLSSILSSAEATIRQIDAGQARTPHTRQMLDRIVQQAERTGQIIKRLRTLAQKHEPNCQTLDLRDVTNEAIELIKLEAQHRNIGLQLDMPDTPAMVCVDAIEIQQVILNLVRNAFDAMDTTDTSQPLVTVYIHEIDNGQVVLEVADTGPGLDQQTLDQIFNPFFTTKDDGLGIGLSISRSILEAHKGSLWAENREPSGASFFFSVPSTGKEHQP